MMIRNVLACSLTIAALNGLAAVPDATSALEYLGTPSAKRWSNRAYMAVTDLKFHDGKLWVSGGATEANAGPCPLQYIDPKTKEIVVEKSAGTENVSVFKVFSDGRLYVPSQDPRDYDSVTDDDGYLFARNKANDWTFYKGCAQQQLIDNVSKNTKMGGFVHVWDAAEYKGRIFIGGYGISSTPDFGKTWTCASSCWKYGKMAIHSVNGVYDFTKKCYKTPTGVTDSRPEKGYGTYRRELQFMKFNDRLFAIPDQNVPVDVPTKYYDAQIEVHRYNESTKQFCEVTNRMSRVFPGCTVADLRMTRPTEGAVSVIPCYQNLKLWHTTPFANRVFYVVSTSTSYTNRWGSARKGYTETQYPFPLYACAADPSSDGLFTATRLNFGTDEFPFDFLVKDDTIYALTTRYISSTKKVRHTVWRSRDGKAFTQLFTFDFHQHLISMEQNDGCFYFGAGYKSACQANDQLDSTADAAGAVYRVKDPTASTTTTPTTTPTTTTNGSSTTTSGSVVNLTKDLKFLANPAKSRWTSGGSQCAVSELRAFNGRIYVGSGDTSTNPGPVWILSLNASGAYTNEFIAGTENINRYRVFSDGRLWAASQDPHEAGPNIGHFFRRESSGKWTALKTMPGKSAGDVSYATHIWDIAEMNGSVFGAGFGIGVSTNGWAGTVMKDATPNLGGYRNYRGYYVYNGKVTDSWFTNRRRFMGFMKDKKNLVCIPSSMNYPEDSTFNSKNGPEVWVYDWKKAVFVCKTNTWENLYPGLKKSDFVVCKIETQGDKQRADMVARRTTSFKNQTLYYAGTVGTSSAGLNPLFGCVATIGSDGLVKAMRLDFGGDYPWDFKVKGDTAYALANHWDATKKLVVNTVWKTTDGTNFTKVATADFPQEFTSFEIDNGYIFFGTGAKASVSSCWPMTNTTDLAGNIYRAPFTSAGSSSSTGTGTTTGGSSAGSGTSSGSGTTTTTTKKTTSETAPSGLVDLTKPTGTFTAPSGAIVMLPFNDNKSTSQTTNRVCIEKTDFSIVYDFGKATKVDAYRIYNLSTYNQTTRAPKAWTFAGSNDKSTWKTLDTRSGETSWGSGEGRYYPFLTAAGSYRYYRIHFTANNGDSYTQFQRLEFYCVKPDTASSSTGTTTTTTTTTTTKTTSETAPSGLVDLTKPTGTFTATSGGLVMLPFNDNTNTSQTTDRVCIEKTDFSIVYDFGKATKVDAYRIYNLSTCYQTARAPKAWTFAGSNDMSTWKTLDTRSGEMSWGNGEGRYYPFLDKAGSYRYYRIHFTANNGNSYTQFQRLEFYCVKSATTTTTTKANLGVSAPATDAADGAASLPAPVLGTPTVGAAAQANARLALTSTSEGVVMSVPVANAKAGLWYTAYVSETLGGEFVPAGASVQAADDGLLVLSVPKNDRPSLFVKIVVSQEAVR